MKKGDANHNNTINTFILIRPTLILIQPFVLKTVASYQKHGILQKISREKALPLTTRKDFSHPDNPPHLFREASKSRTEHLLRGGIFSIVLKGIHNHTE
ncbi:hypothetical protein [Bacteroides sp.]|uniref:hypothetical protein n=1 Tax=Bacteroides sp. TaxID=29523 RepID=UPI0023BFABF1|nr:hypothetical protein [Bacteroides sp.]MDE5759627.1 hypothetical protein [Bacteroides sp.]MDE6214850.1 hypothetical protein [Bacteroides sp.]